MELLEKVRIKITEKHTNQVDRCENTELHQRINHNVHCTIQDSVATTRISPS